MVFIVSYDLQKPGQRYDELIQLIRGNENWARLGEYAYLIESDLTPVELRDRFLSVLDGNDKLFVGKVSSPAAWTGMSEDVTKWIKDRL